MENLLIMNEVYIFIIILGGGLMKKLFEILQKAILVQMEEG